MTFPIVGPIAGNKTRVGWATSITNAVNDHENRLDAIEAQIVRKSSDETLTTSTGMQNDDALKFSVLANAAYRVRLSLDIGSPVAASFKFQVTVPAGTVDQGGRFLYNPTATTVGGGVITASSNWLETGFTTLGAGVHQYIEVWGLFITGGSSGT